MSSLITLRKFILIISQLTIWVVVQSLISSSSGMSNLIGRPIVLGTVLYMNHMIIWVQSCGTTNLGGGVTSLLVINVWLIFWKWKIIGICGEGKQWGKKEMSNKKTERIRKGGLTSHVHGPVRYSLPTELLWEDVLVHVQYRVNAVLSSSAQEHRGENLIGLCFTEQSRHLITPKQKGFRS